jgi:GWxTD domain-containing protein
LFTQYAIRKSPYDKYTLLKLFQIIKSQMKKRTLILAIFTLIALRLFAVEVSVTHSCLRSGTGNYAEFNIYIVGRSVKWEQVDTINSQARIEVGVYFKQKGQVIQFDKYALKSPKSLDPENFLDIKRYEITNGLYDIEVSIKDLNNPSDAVTYKSNIIVDFDNINLRMSDIQLLANVIQDSANQRQGAKNGVYMEPLAFNYYDRNYSTLIFYSEIYNADQVIGDDFMVSYSIMKANSEPNARPIMIAHKRKKATAYIANLHELDIQKLESGNYRLIVSMRNRNNDLMNEKEVFFQRSNPFLEVGVTDTITEDALQKEWVWLLDEKALNFSLRSILMKVPDEDVSLVNDMLKNKELTAQKRYVFRHFAKISPSMPEQAYDEYSMTIKTVDRQYSNGFGFGFETDRGRIFLRYGRPDDVVTVENEIGAPPYEIWVYYKLDRTQQTNVKFLFYNPSLVVNGYRLLHSTCRNEVMNPRWKYELYKNLPNERTGSFIDGTSGVQRNFNRRAEELFADQ